MKRLVALLLSGIILSGSVLPAYGAEETSVSVGEASREESGAEASEEVAAEAASEATSMEADSSFTGNISEASSEGSSNKDGSVDSSAETSTESKTGSSIEASTETSSESSSESSSDASTEYVSSESISKEISTESSSDASSGSSEDVSTDASSDASSEEPSEEASLPEDYYTEFPTGYLNIEESADYESVSDGARSNGLLMASYLPSSYRTEVLPALKSQSPYGTCWSFAVNALAEINLAKKYNAAPDLSELHLSYFGYRWVNDPLEGFGDPSTPANISGNLKFGGLLEQGLLEYTRGVGPVDEFLADYARDAEKANTMGLDDELCYQRAAQFKDYLVQELDVNNLDPVKQLIYDYGAVAISFHAESSMSASTNADIYNLKNNCYYSPKKSYANHAVAVVGWDDSFSKDKFVQTPPGDGAFLVRNSWSTGGFSDNQKYSGYFWMSYYEASLQQYVYAVDFDTAEKYDNNYQYDLSIVPKYFTQSQAVNFYTAHAAGGKNGETIKAVGFDTNSSNLQLRIDIYKGAAGIDDLKESNIVSSQNVCTTYAGFHTITLDTPVEVASGETFAVVIRDASPEGQGFGISYENGATVMTNYGTYSYGPSQMKKSYAMPVESDFWALSPDLSIKVFTDNKSDGGQIEDPSENPTEDPTQEQEEEQEESVTSLTLDKKTIKLGVGQRGKISVASIIPVTADDSVVFSSNKPEVVSFDEAGRRSGEFIALSAGTAVITATARGGKTAKCTVTVGKVVKELSLSGKNGADSVAVGKTLQLVTVFNGGDKNDQPLNKEVVYSIVSGSSLVQKNAFASISSKGVLKGLKEGVVKVRVTSTTDKNDEVPVYAETDIYVYSALKSASLSRKSLTMAAGGKYVLAVNLKSLGGDGIVTGSFDRETGEARHLGDEGQIEWKVYPEGALTLEENGSSCNILAPETVPAKGISATVKASFKAYGATKTTVLSCKVSVKEGYITGISVSPGKVSMNRGEKISLAAGLSPVAPAETGVVWEIPEEYRDDLCFEKSAGAEIEYVDTVTTSWTDRNTVTLVAKANGIIGKRKAVVWATTIGKGKKGSSFARKITVTIGNQATELEVLKGGKPVGGSIEAPEPIAVGKSFTLKAVAYAKRDGSGQFKAGNQKVKWSSDNEDVATVSASGKVIGISNGVARITATSLSDSDVSFDLWVGVYTDVTKLTLEKSKISMSMPVIDSVGRLQASGQYATVAAFVTPDGVYDNEGYALCGNKVKWSVASGVGKVAFAVVDLAQLKAAGGASGRQKLLASLNYAVIDEKTDFVETGRGQVLVIRALDSGTVKVNAAAGKKKTTCTVKIK